MNILRDLFDKKILKYTMLPFLIDLFFWAILFFFFSDEIKNFLFTLILYLPFSSNIVNLLTNIGSFLLIFVLYYALSISTLGIFSSFFVDKIVLRINEKYYNLPLKKSSLKNLINGIYISIKSFLIYLIIFIFTFYLLFIPVVNIFYQMFMMSLLNKKPLIFDSSYLFCDYKELETKYNFQFLWRIFFTSFIYLLPVISLFGYSFQLVILTHFVLKKCKNN